ncbi:MAG TPA: hypothetical protein VFS56_11740 [Gemmatimonadaceae bacterium]|nr:hypothetical protein [Gemmatimonadaceae bacterium]
MTPTVRIYINSTGIDVPASATALEAVQSWNVAEAAAIGSGERMITDSRGLPADPESPVHNGAIFRIVRARGSASSHDDLQNDFPAS